MRRVAGSLIMICGMVLAGLRMAVPHPRGVLSQVLLEQNVHVLTEKFFMKIIPSFPAIVSQLFVSNLVSVSHICAVMCQAVLILLLSYFLSQLVKG